MSNLEEKRNFFRTMFSEIPFNKVLGLQLTAIEKNHITLQFSQQAHLIGNYLHNILHGGVISSVLDMAGGTMAMLAAMEKSLEANEEETLDQLVAQLTKSSTISLHIDYIKPGKGQYFTAHAYLLHSGNKISFTRMELYNEHSSLIANASANYLIS